MVEQIRMVPQEDKMVSMAQEQVVVLVLTILLLIVPLVETVVMELLLSDMQYKYFGGY